MKNVCVFGGTTEGRELAERLAAAGITVDVHVATDYGQQMLTPSKLLHVENGRLSPEQMRACYQSRDYVAVVDATHPFAVEVTRNIKESLQGVGIPYFRLLRDVDAQENTKDCYWYDSTKDCVKALGKSEGMVFLTTGSKELPEYCTPELKERLIVRVLPSVESISICEKNGIPGSRIVACQGPFSQEENIAQFRRFQASHVVTKQTGKTGGLPEKIEAARAVGATLHIIGCPESYEETCYTLSQVCEELETLCACSIPPLMKESATEGKVQVSLCGVGMGSPQGMTCEVLSAITEADVVFGAKRLLALCPEEKAQYPYYLSKDILPILRKGLAEGSFQKIVILFSGDSGFYSGATRMAEALRVLPALKVSLLPGISSLVAFAAKLSVSWQDAGLYSTHGVMAGVWEQQFCEAFLHEHKSFFLTSGKEDVERMCELVTELGGLTEGDHFFYGYQLSYPSEVVHKLDVAAPPEMEGLYVVYLYREKPERKKLTPGIPDEAFLRDKVPMTKEEVRSVALGKMNLFKGAVVYDIGGGTGSVSVEVARIHPDIRVYALEQKDEALALLKRNLSKFHLHNVVPIAAKAPDGLNELPPADVAFLGGTKGALASILATLYEKNPHMQVLFTAVTLESVVAMEEALRAYEEADVSICQIAVNRAKPVGSYRMMTANNPVFLYDIHFTKKEREDA